MTTFYTNDGVALGATVIHAPTCVVTQIKTETRDGYQAVQLGADAARRINAPLRGHLLRSGKTLFRRLAEFKVESLEGIETGQEVKCDIFAPGDTVKAIGKSKGRGFAGGVKRYGFKGGPKTHGQSDRHRAPGSIGASAFPARVMPGLKMAGRYGGARKTVKGLRVLTVDVERGLLIVAGQIPGHRNSLVRLELQHKVTNN